jgi:hypothetical protein
MKLQKTQRKRFRLKERGSELANLLHLHVTKDCEFPELQIPIFHTNTSKSS